MSLWTNGVFEMLNEMMEVIEKERAYLATATQTEFKCCPIGFIKPLITKGYRRQLHG